MPALDVADEIRLLRDRIDAALEERNYPEVRVLQQKLAKLADTVKPERASRGDT